MGDAAVETLTQSFTDDPLMRWLFEDDTRRPAQLREWWAWIIENRLGHMHLRETDDGRSAAIWHGPDPVDDERPAGAFPEMLVRLLGREIAWRKLEGLSVIPAAHPTRRHWYLAAVGTRPAFQGQGSALRVIAPVLERCDAERVPAYLESSNQRNVPFYERLGFVSTGMIHVPDGPDLTPMWREPLRSAAPAAS